MKKTLTSIQQKITSIDSVNDLRWDQQRWFYSKFEDEYDIQGYSVEATWLVYWKIHASDSLVYKWSNTKSDKPAFFRKIGFRTPQELDAFIESNTIDRVALLDKERFKRQQEETTVLLYKASQDIDSSKELSKYKWILLCLLLTAFPLRYFFIAIVWSIKTLRT